MKKIVFLVVLVLISQFAFAEYSSEDITWNGFVKTYINDIAIDSNTVLGTIYVNNLENHPLVGGRLSIKISSGDYYYPSQYSKENIIYESVIDDIWVLPNSQKGIEFTFPKVSPGNYKLDVYFWVLKSKMIGSDSILYNPDSTSFSIPGEEIKKVIINREKTFFGENIVGPRGFPVNPESEFIGKVFIKNESNVEKKDLKLILTICDWSVSFCKNPNKKIIEIEKISPSEEKEIDVSLIAPIIPSAYEINIELKNKEEFESIYKSRVIVSGGTSKLRKIFMDGLENSDYSFTTILTGSPDHFSNPTFEDFDLSFKLFKTEKLVEEFNEKINKIESNELITKKFNIISNDFDKACVSIIKNGKTYEEECFSIELSKIKEDYDSTFPKLINVSWNYIEAEEKLVVNLEKENINSKIIILENSNTIFEKEILNKKQIYTEEIIVPKSTIILIVDDLDSRRQQSFEIFLDEKLNLISNQDINYDELPTLCTGLICSENHICNGDSYNSSQGICCTKECVPSVSSKEVEEFLPLITIIALISLIVAIVVIRNTLKKVKK